jgi:hypothetical protein
MSGKYMLIMALAIILCYFFGKGPFFDGIRNVTYQKYTFFKAWICDKYARCSKKVSVEQSLTYAIL